MKLLPIVYVTDMERAVRFYETLGFPPRTGSRSGQWLELDAGADAILALHHADRLDERQAGRVELALVSAEPLEQVAGRLRSAGVGDLEDIVDEAFGRSFGVLDPDGTRIQVNEHDHELYT